LSRGAEGMEGGDGCFATDPTTGAGVEMTLQTIQVDRNPGV